MSLEYEPSSELLHISAKQLFLDTGDGQVVKTEEDSIVSTKDTIVFNARRLVYHSTLG